MRYGKNIRIMDQVNLLINNKSPEVQIKAKLLKLEYHLKSKDFKQINTLI